MCGVWRLNDNSEGVLLLLYVKVVACLVTY